MKIIEREHIRIDLWNSLVANTPESGFFSYAWYLDATAENWCVLVNEDYSAGIALPFTKKLGVELLYTPIFVRYVEWLGDSSFSKEANRLIRERFSNMHISIRTKLLGVGYEEYVYQEIRSVNERKLGSQGKRMLNKAAKNELSVLVEDDYHPVLDIVKSELKGKFEGIDSTSLLALEKLFEAGSAQGVLKTYTLKNEGGIVCFENKHSLLYLKGTVSSKMKEKGGMYLALNMAIVHALTENKVFDFGGSRVEGVKRFNHNLGGSDVHYYCYKLDRTPFWFKFARRIKKTWKK